MRFGVMILTTSIRGMRRSAAAALVWVFLAGAAVITYTPDTGVWEASTGYNSLLHPTSVTAASVVRGAPRRSLPDNCGRDAWYAMTGQRVDRRTPGRCGVLILVEVNGMPRRVVRGL